MTPSPTTSHLGGPDARPAAGAPLPGIQGGNVWLPARLRALRAAAMAEDNLFLLLAVIIGLFSGLSVVLFRIAIDWSRITLLGSALSPPAWRTLLVPTLGGLVVAVLVIKVFPLVRGSGVNQTKAAVYIYDGYIPFSTVIGKFITCALAIGSGQSLGPEDPSLQIGAGIASALGRRLQFSRERIRLIAPVGAAAGLAAAFNAPISSVLFVIEEVIGRWTAGVLGAIVLAAVSSVTVVRLFLGSEPLFRIPAYRLVHPTELLVYAALGIAGGLASLLFVKILSYARPRVRMLPPWTRYFQPAIAGLIIGVIGLRFPQVMGAGYDSMDQAMHNQYTWQILAVLAGFKILATCLSFTGGAPGGMFAPTLFIGAMLGGALGGVEHHFFPRLTASVGSYALVGMGTLFAGFLRAPMTSVFMVLEVSGNYSIIVPVMISNTIAYLINLKYQPTALFDLLSRQEGVDLPSMEELREQSPLLVEDAMRAPSGPPLHEDDTLAAAVAKSKAWSTSHVPVSHWDGTWSLIAKNVLKQEAATRGADLLRAILPVSDRVPVVHSDQPLYMAMRRMGEWPYLPVVHRAAFTRLQGTISLDDILKRYRALRIAD